MTHVYFRQVVAVLVGALLIIFASYVYSTPAEAQGLIVCGMGDYVGTGQFDATGCQACHLFQLIDRIVQFLILLAVPIASLLFAYAGILYFTSGGGHGKEEAKNIFKDALFGFIIALCGFLIVDTIIKTLVNGSFTGPSWNTVQCVSGNDRNITRGGLGFIALENLGGLRVGDAPTITPNVITSGNCSPSELESAWGSNSARMSCIIQGESNCRNIPSGSDIGADGTPVSWGRYQINISANQVTCPGQAPLNCPSAFTSPYTGTSRSTMVRSDSASRQLFDQCVAAANRPDCATLTAQQIFNRQGFGAWGADRAGNCGALQYNNM